MTLTLTIPGCGSSAGVPRPALGWGKCDPNNPKNRRRRCSLLVERASDNGLTRIVIDTSPDLREQLIDAEVDHIDAVFLTHEHADQTHGIDDLRSVVLHQRRRIPVYLNQSTAKDIMHRFSYCFVSPPGSEYPPILNQHSIEAGETASIEGKGGPIALSAFIMQAALCAASEPFQRRRRAVLDRPLQAEACRHHQHAFRPGLRGAAPKPAAERRPGV